MGVLRVSLFIIFFSLSTIFVNILLQYQTELDGLALLKQTKNFQEVEKKGISSSFLKKIHEGFFEELKQQQKRNADSPQITLKDSELESFQNKIFRLVEERVKSQFFANLAMFAVFSVSTLACLWRAFCK